MNDKMTFNELVEKIADETGASKTLIHDMLMESVSLAKDSLGESGEATLKGLGKFSLRWHETRQGRNPQTGEPLEIPAHNSIAYKPDSELRKFINRKYAHLKLKILKTKGLSVAEEAVIFEDEDDEPEYVDEGSENRAADETSEKKPFNWLWLIIPLLIIIIAFLIWPKEGEQEDISQEPDQTEMISSQPVQEATDELVTEEDVKPVEETKSISEGIASATYTIGAKDRLWTLAQDHYSQGNLWPNIYRVNKQTVKDPDVLKPGSLIDVPALKGTPGNLTAQDKQDIANGFLDVYQVYSGKNKYKAFHYLWVAKELGGKDALKSVNIPEKDLNRIQKMEGSLQIQ